jgi:hypothetical protein
MPLVTRFFSFDDLTPSQGWALLDWSRAQGADEFTIGALVSPVAPDRMRAFFGSLRPFSLAQERRRLLSAPVGGQLTRPVER